MLATSPELVIIDAAVRMLWYRLQLARDDERGLAGRQLLITIVIIGVVVVGGYLIYKQLNDDSGPPTPTPERGDS